MKIIDLLNIWVKDRSKLPEKIKIDNEIFEYDRYCNLYKNSDTECYLIQNYLNCVEKLNKEVEVIEENKEIEEIGTTKMIEEKQGDLKILEELIHICESKINEIVREVNKINKEREEK